MNKKLLIVLIVILFLSIISYLFIDKIAYIISEAFFGEGFFNQVFK